MGARGGARIVRSGGSCEDRQEESGHREYAVACCGMLSSGHDTAIPTKSRAAVDHMHERFAASWEPGLCQFQVCNPDGPDVDNGTWTRYLSVYADSRDAMLGKLPGGNGVCGEAGHLR
ncbi:hypothetical protein STEG23_019376 [Scotinomys teguina]